MQESVGIVDSFVSYSDRGRQVQIKFAGCVYEEL